MQQQQNKMYKRLIELSGVFFQSVKNRKEKKNIEELLFYFLTVIINKLCSI